MRIDVTVHEPGGKPARGGGFLLVWPGGDKVVTLGESADEAGRISFVVNASDQVLALRVGAPGYWVTRAGGPTLPGRVVLSALPAGGDRRWWHEILGCMTWDPDAGAGIRIGVVDTAFRPAAGLDHVQLRSLSGRDLRPSFDITPTHGEMVCRLIGQRTNGPNEFGGISPGAALIALDAGASDGELNPVAAARAILQLAEDERCDIINLSAGQQDEQPSLRTVVRQASRAGTLCVVAAGNDGLDKVSFPARYPECVAVGGIGLLGWGPQDSMVRFISDSVETEPGACGSVGGFGVFHYPSSCFGEGLDVVAPGVGLVICRDMAPLSLATGTSFAAPLTVGVLAATLAGDERYLSMARDEKRAAHARRVLEGICQRTGISLKREGFGVPRLPDRQRGMKIV